MTTNNKKNKKNSAARKLIPAIGMLTVSAMMLSSSTYAWFTMSREVEVTGIKMTASLPEDTQISLGNNTGIISNTSGSLVKLDGTASDDRKVLFSEITAPDGATGSSATAAEIKNTTDWYNTVDFSQHYAAGKLKPASSTDGNYLFKTADVTKVGKDLTNTASFAQVTADDRAGLYRLGTYAADTDSGNLYTDSSNLAQGYYIDFPVWFRTSTKAEANGGAGNEQTGKIGADGLELGVIATITQRTASDASEDLYHAVRVAVLTGEHTGSLGVLNNSSDANTARFYDRYDVAAGSVSQNNGATKVVCKTAVGADQAVMAPGNLIWSPQNAYVTNADTIYGNADFVEQAGGLTDGLYTTGESVVKIPLATTGDYGYSQKYIIRVWLEGEDINCWNETAGQDFDIALKFVRFNSSPTQTADATASASNTTSGGTATKGTSLAISVNANDGTAKGTITYTRSANTVAWTAPAVTDASSAATTNLLAGTDTRTYRLVDGTTFANLADLTAYLNKYDGLYDFTGLVLTATS